MKDGWQRCPFEEVISDESGGNTKTPQSEFLPIGQLPIVDQGKSVISGYTNDSTRVCKAKLPVIIFGDHTRCFKFIDFPFCMGADGVKVLRPRFDADEKYLFHYLKNLQLPNAGYDRHFKYLKRTEIVLPPTIAEQKRIAAILDRAEELRSLRRQALGALDAIVQSIFLEMFGDPVTNPKGWAIVTIRKLLESASYGTSEKAGTDGAFPILRMNNLTYSGGMDFTDLKFIDLKTKEVDRYTVRTGDVLFNRTNSAELVGKTAIYRASERMAYAGYLVRLRVNEDNHPEFLAAFLTSKYAKRMLRGICKSIIGMANINANEVQEMRISKPPLALQQEFARRIEAIEQLKATHRESLAQLDALFASLQHRAFRGEL